MTAALRARRLCPDLDITVVEKSNYISTANCSIPAYLSGKIESHNSLQLLTPEKAASSFRLNVLTGHAAREIQPVKRLLTVENLSTNQSFDLRYERMIIATGASPVRPDWPNISAKGIFTLRNLDDARNLRRYIENKKPEKVIIIGTGTIAQACASVLRSYGMHVLMIGITSSLMDDLEEKTSKHIRESLTNADIDLYFTDYIGGFKVSLDGDVSGIDLSNESIPCNGVLLALGVKPNTEIAVSADISTSIAGAIRIDRHLMTSRRGIYACGDCAITTHRITHKPFYWPLATIALRQGRLAGENACGGNCSDPGTLASRLWTCFDLQIGKVGLSSKQAKEEGYQYQITDISAPSKQEIFNGSKMNLILVNDKKDGRIIGAQITGYEGVHARLNTLTAAIEGKLSIRDLEYLDLAYNPSISNIWDPIHIAARLGRKQ